MKTILSILSFLLAFTTNKVFTQTGAADFSFDGDGRLTTSFQKPVSVYSRASAVQKDGKTVVMGYEYDGFFPVSCYIARFNAGGSLDETFGDGGKLRTLENERFLPLAITIQQNGKIVAVGQNQGSLYAAVMVVRFNTNGTLDNTFSQVGKVTTQIGQTSSARSVAIQSDGKIVVVGQTFNGSDLDFLLLRYNTDGTLDNSFNGTGIITRFGATDDEGAAIALLPDGKIVAGGYIDNNGKDFVVARYSSSGKLDKTFEGDGVVITDIAGDDFCRSMAVQSDGKIVVGGESNPVTGGDAVVCLTRYNTDGSLDATFGANGKHTEGLQTTGGAQSIVINAAGKIIVGAFSNNFGAILRFNTNASLDVTFSGDGKVYTSLELLSTGTGYLNITVTLQPEGKIALAGTYSNIAASDLVVFRYNSKGNLDQTFNLDGIAMAEFKAESVGSSVRSIAIQPNKKIVVAGYSGLARYNRNGSLDTTFNLNGEGIVYFENSYIDPYAVAIQTDGKIVVAGRYDNGNDRDFAVVRLNSNGSLDKTFNLTGKVVTDFSNSEDFVENGCLALQADGKILVAGSTFSPANLSYDVAIVRYNSNGTLDKTFDGDGKVTTDIETRNQEGKAIALQTDGKIVVAGNIKNSSNNYDFAVFRYNTNGKLDLTFNSTGVKTTDFFQKNDYGKSVKIQSDGKIVVGGYSNNGLNNDFAVVRYNTNGSHDNTFSGNGNVYIGIETSSNDYGTSVAIQADGKILLGGYYNSSNGGLNNFALVRFNSNGTIDNSFGGSGGKKVTDFGSVEDFVYSAALQPDGQLVMGGSSNGNFALARFLTAAPAIAATIVSDNKVLKNVSATDVNVSPNPLSSKATISFSLQKNEYVNIQLYNADGQKVRDLASGLKVKGFYQIQLIKEDLTAGIYFIKMSTTSQQVSKKVIIQ